MLNCRWYAIVFRCLSNDVALKGFFLQHYAVVLLFCVAIVISEPFFGGLIFDLILLLSDSKSLRLDIFGLKRNLNKRNSFLNSIR